MTAPVSSAPHRVTATVSAQAPASAKPASNFERYLEEPMSAQQKQALTFGFGDLGMFGRYGAITPSIQAAAGAQDRETQPSGRMELSDVSAGPARQAGAAGVVATDDAGAQAGLVNSATTARATEDSVPFAQADVQPGNTLPDADQPLTAIEMDEPQSAQKAAAAPAMPDGRRVENFANLVLISANGAVSIVARGLVADPAEMRRRLAQVAEEYGVTVSNIRLNGDAGTEFTVQEVPHGRFAG